MNQSPPTKTTESDWNDADSAFDWSTAPEIQLDDETLRDGLQNPSVVDPSIDEKIRLLHLMDRLGIHTANIGLPGAGPRAVEAVAALAQEIVDSKLSIQANCAARTCTWMTSRPRCTTPITLTWTA